jgi:hypothetical protein
MFVVSVKRSFEPLKKTSPTPFVKLPALKGEASRKGNYLFQIASLNPALKGGDCREANRSKP